MDLFGRKAQAELSVAKAMLVEQAQWLEGAVALLAERDKEVNKLKNLLNGAYTQIQALQPPKRPTISSQPLYMNENEEDLKWQLENKVIDTATYSELMKELEFENAEVSFAVEDLPESFHY